MNKKTQESQKVSLVVLIAGKNTSVMMLYGQEAGYQTT